MFGHIIQDFLCVERTLDVKDVLYILLMQLILGLLLWSGVRLEDG
jgi:hypothetical protein